MANEVRNIISKISSDRTAKVKAIREIEAQLRPSGISDAERKSLNEERRKLEKERSALEAEGNRLSKLAKTAEEYIKLNKELEKLEASITTAEAQGRDPSQFKSKRTGAVRRLQEIAPDVEREFPSIKVTPVVKTDRSGCSCWKSYTRRRRQTRNSDDTYTCDCIYNNSWCNSTRSTSSIG
jgi:chromosome segregation ATPase